MDKQFDFLCPKQRKKKEDNLKIPVKLHFPPLSGSNQKDNRENKTIEKSKIKAHVKHKIR